MGRVRDRNSAVQKTGYTVDERQIIWGPEHSGEYWISDGWIWGPTNSGLYWIDPHGEIRDRSGRRTSFRLDQDVLVGPEDESPPWLR